MFARAAGMTMLAGNLSLAAQGVNDADLLAFVPAVSAQRYEPNIENVSAAIAKWAKHHFLPVSAGDAARVAVALTHGRPAGVRAAGVADALGELRRLAGSNNFRRRCVGARADRSAEPPAWAPTGSWLAPQRGRR